MRSTGLILLLAAVPITVPAAEDLRVDQLRRDVQRLERMVLEQSRRIAQLERELSQRGAPASPRRASSDDQPRRATAEAWISPESWNRIREGMTELEVIAILGLPATVRNAPDDGGKLLYYSAEVGETGIFSGSIRIEEGRVREVNRPELKPLQ